MHPSHWGKICFLTTSDGENCGLVKNLASLGLVSTCIMEQDHILDKLYECGLETLLDDTSTALDEKHKIFVDGDWVGICKDSASFVAKLRALDTNAQNGSATSDVTVFFVLLTCDGIPLKTNLYIEIKRDQHNGEVRIFTNAGRILRPLLVVRILKKIRDIKGEFSFQSLLDNGIIELIGPEEEEDCQTAWGITYLFTAKEENPPMRYTHCELDSSFLAGISCGIIPFVNHDHARRILYQVEKHSQQAIGFSTTNPNIRVDTNIHQLYYPHKPLVRTMLSDCLGKPSCARHHKGILPHPEYFNGQCAIVAVYVHLGYNQEDSIVMNRASMERGMFRSEHIRSYKAEVLNKEALGTKVKAEDSINFGKIQSKIGRVDSLDDDGFPFIGANLQTSDIIIGKHSESGVDHSIKLKHTERGMVQKVVLSANDDGKNFAAVSLRQILVIFMLACMALQVRAPCLGDKFSSMHGQKGVLGFLESQENFPFTIQGIVPDIVINPHAFPSRQTPGQLLEAALGKGIALGGALKYATPFSTPSMEAVTDQLHRQSQIQEHRASPPSYSSAVADRKRFGGIKFGEMERDCLIAHGAAANLHERLFTLSDSSQMHICRKCKNMANVIQRSVLGGRKIRGPYCRFCESAEHVVKANVPYGAKLLCQELFSMGISLKFDTDVC
ncbi:unnamed protein product [Fraxinus pennsylvanica]|uniref:DNA-directed RNA polymerase subunit beta n=1 Tax=Fraxinus pennsylvanica TaxID=56036 RepID=A0AAD2E2A0_9LAMI|nr:unnamed protein product [Fraxinus pennsylvanica]